MALFRKKPQPQPFDVREYLADAAAHETRLRLTTDAEHDAHMRDLERARGPVDWNNPWRPALDPKGLEKIYQQDPWIKYDLEQTATSDEIHAAGQRVDEYLTRAYGQQWAGVPDEVRARRDDVYSLTDDAGEPTNRNVLALRVEDTVKLAEADRANWVPQRFASPYWEPNPPGERQTTNDREAGAVDATAAAEKTLQTQQVQRTEEHHRQLAADQTTVRRTRSTGHGIDL